MIGSNRYRVNRPNVILENFDDEIVIVNLASGNYYSVDAVGSEIWDLAGRGAATAEIAAQLSCAYDVPAGAMEQAVKQFIEELIAEDLIVPDAAAQPLKPDGACGAARKPFAPPILHKYTDMQELLLIDPIHEVDETGWPNIAGPVGRPGPESKK
jgi:hypothetical protein